MYHRRYLVIDHQPDVSAFQKLAGLHQAEVNFAAGFLQAAGSALLSPPHTLWIRRDLPWLPKGSVSRIFLQSPLFSGTQVVFYIPDEIRRGGSLPLHALPLAMLV